MLRRLFLIAIFGLSGIASVKAESSLSLYGTLDMGMSYQSATDSIDERFHGGSKFGLISGGQSTNLIGLTGKEDIGSGIRLSFVLENSFNIGNGGPAFADRIFARQSWIGADSSSLGYLRFGRQFNFARDYLNPLTPFSGGDFARASAGINFATGGTERLSNTLKFESADLSGFKFGLGYSFSAQIPSAYISDGNNGDAGISIEPGKTTNYNFGQADNLRALTAGLKYQSGPVYLTMTSDTFYPNAATANDKYRAITSRSVGGYYDLGGTKIAAAYGQTRNGWINGVQPIVGFDQTITFNTLNNSIIFDENVAINSYLLAFTATTSPDSSLFGAWRIVNPLSNMRQYAIAPINTQNSLSLGYTYNFTKRTNLYVYTTYTSNYATVEGVTSYAVGVGLRHKF